MTIKLKVNDMLVIKAIIETGSVSSAAAVLGSQQANVSRALSLLETNMGLKIFNRTAKGFILTDFGESFKDDLYQFLSVYDELRHSIDNYKRKPAGRITIAAPSGAISFLVKLMLPRLSQAYPDIAISFVTTPPLSSINKVVMDPDWDIMLAANYPEDENLVARHIAVFEVGFFAGNNYLALNSINSPNDLAYHDCILLQNASSVSNIWSYKEPLTDDIASVNVCGKYVCDNMQVAIELAKLGLGIIATPLYNVRDEVASGALVHCLPNHYNVNMQGYLIYRKRSHLPFRVQVIVDDIISTLNRLKLI
jgi:DNA-binding transcriptional LysR family regulator